MQKDISRDLSNFLVPPFDSSIAFTQMSWIDCAGLVIFKLNLAIGCIPNYSGIKIEEDKKKSCCNLDKIYQSRPVRFCKDVISYLGSFLPVQFNEAIFLCIFDFIVSIIASVAIAALLTVSSINRDTVLMKEETFENSFMLLLPIGLHTFRTARRAVSFFFFISVFWIGFDSGISFLDGIIAVVAESRFMTSRMYSRRLAAFLICFILAIISILLYTNPFGSVIQKGINRFVFHVSTLVIAIVECIHFSWIVPMRKQTQKFGTISTIILISTYYFTGIVAIVIWKNVNSGAYLAIPFFLFANLAGIAVAKAWMIPDPKASAELLNGGGWDLLSFPVRIMYETISDSVQKVTPKVWIIWGVSLRYITPMVLISLLSSKVDTSISDFTNGLSLPVTLVGIIPAIIIILVIAFSAAFPSVRKRIYIDYLSHVLVPEVSSAF
jgi:hypothetical protein